MIRPAVATDADAMAACLDAAYADARAHIGDLPPMSEGCAEEIARFQVLIAEIDASIAGVLVLIPDDEALRLANVAVHPSFRGSGLGRALVAYAETEASRQGYREIHLTTHAQMPENVGLYRHLGWNVDRRVGNKVMMKKSL